MLATQSQTIRLYIPALVALACLSLVFALLTGSADVQWRTLWPFGGVEADAMSHSIVWQLRLPRALRGFVVGALLSVAGVYMQVLLRNPLADPYILGVSGGAAVGALLAILLGFAGVIVSFGAATGALLSMLLVFGLAHGRGTWSSTRLLLTGVVVAAGWGAMIGLLLALSPDTMVRGMLFWLMGDLGHSAPPWWSAVVLIIALCVSFYFARSLNVLAYGEKQAKSLGVSVAKLRVLLYLFGSLLTAAAVTLAGIIGFVGLVVPHMLRLVGGGDHRWLLPAAALLGGSLVVVADTLARTLLAPQQLPVGVVTAFIGVPLFLYLLYRGSGTFRS